MRRKTAEWIPQVTNCTQKDMELAKKEKPQETIRNFSISSTNNAGRANFSGN